MKRAITLPCQSAAETTVPLSESVMGTALPAPPSIIHPSCPCPHRSCPHFSASSLRRLPLCTARGLKQCPDATRPTADDHAMTWVLCLHQNAQQHLPRLEEKEDDPFRGGFSYTHTHTHTQYVSLVIYTYQLQQNFHWEKVSGPGGNFWSKHTQTNCPKQPRASAFSWSTEDTHLKA